MIKITPEITIKNSELKFTFIRSPKPGGQNVNKVSTAVELRFNIKSLSLTDSVRNRLKTLCVNKISAEGELVIKASTHRTQLQNKQEAIKRLQAYILKASIVPKKRKKTKATKASQEKRLSTKKLHAKKKNLRGKHNAAHE